MSDDVPVLGQLHGIQPHPVANLGLASTEDLFRELICRFVIPASGGNVTALTKINRALHLAEMLGELRATEREYRTVDSH
jgi:hypothetical protein